MVAKLKAVEKEVGSRKSLIHARGYALSLKKPEEPAPAKETNVLPFFFLTCSHFLLYL